MLAEKHIYDYLAKNPGSVIHVRTDEPCYSDIEDVEYDWEYSVYGHVSELIADDILPPLGKAVVQLPIWMQIYIMTWSQAVQLLAFYRLLMVLQLTGTQSTRKLLRQQLMGKRLLQLGLQVTRLLTTIIHCITWCPYQVQQIICLVTTSQLLIQWFLTLDLTIATRIPYPNIVCMRQLLLRFLFSSILMERWILVWCPQQAWRLSADLASHLGVLAWWHNCLQWHHCHNQIHHALTGLALLLIVSCAWSNGSSTRRIWVLQSYCCWYHDYCVVLICMFLGMNSERKMKCFEMLAWYFTRLQGFGRVPTTTSFFPLRYKWYCWLWQNVTLWLPLQDTAWKVTFSKLVMTSG